jgi:imidazolonepropionase-like amidohydrolase
MPATLFQNAHVFDGRSPDLLEGRHVLVEDGLIKEVSDRPITTEVDVVDVRGRTLMPGLIDLHTHIWFYELNATRVMRQRSEYVACFAASSLRRSLDFGFTAMRDAGGADPAFARAIAHGVIPGPRFYPSGRMMSQTGGHTDWRDASDEDLDHPPAPGRELSRFTALVDSPDEMRKAVREELRRGATQIKLMMSGGVSSPTDPLDKLQFSDEEIRVAVEEAERRGTYCFAHCHPLISVKKAVEHRIRTIEHATYIDEETACAVAQAGLYVVPTLAVVHALTMTGRELGFPPASMEKLSGMLDVALGSLEIMKRAGVKMGYGTDLLGPHQDQELNEFEIRADILPAHDILVSATSLAAEILMEPRLGVVAPGAFADLIVVDGDPMRDVRIMNQKGRNLPVIMKGGTFHKREI